MSVTTQMTPMALISFDSSTLSGSYQSVGAITISAQVLKITNNSSVDMTISWDGVHDHDFIPKMSGFVLDVTTNGEQLFCAIRKGTNIYVKGSAGTGLIYISAYAQVS